MAKPKPPHTVPHDTHSATESPAGLAMEDLLDVMDALRGEGGCPWDRKQTHRSLVPYLIEEAYEVVEVIEAIGTPGGRAALALREELGDLLFQVVFHARIAEERGDFSFADVAAGLAEKMRERHPHVFAGAVIDSAEELGRIWHEKKMATRDSVLDGIPAHLPALQRAAKVSKAAARAGFDWNATGEILDKAAEELAEFRAEVEAAEATEAAGHAPGETDRDAMEMELGDLFFALVQLGRWRGIDPETALRRSTDKFMLRFGWMEKQLSAGQRPSGELSPDDWWALWHKAKGATGP